MDPHKTTGKAAGRILQDLLRRKRDHSKDLKDEPECLSLHDSTNYPDAEDEMTLNVSIVVLLQYLLRLVGGSKFEAIHM
jgi:hypothetical protein